MVIRRGVFQATSHLAPPTAADTDIRRGVFQASSNLHLAPQQAMDMDSDSNADAMVTMDSMGPMVINGGVFQASFRLAPQRQYWLEQHPRSLCFSRSRSSSLSRSQRVLDRTRQHRQRKHQHRRLTQAQRRLDHTDARYMVQILRGLSADQLDHLASNPAPPTIWDPALSLARPALDHEAPWPLSLTLSLFTRKHRFQKRLPDASAATAGVRQLIDNLHWAAKLGPMPQHTPGEAILSKGLPPAPYVGIRIPELDAFGRILSRSLHASASKALSSARTSIQTPWRTFSSLLKAGLQSAIRRRLVVLPADRGGTHVLVHTSSLENYHRHTLSQRITYERARDYELDAHGNNLAYVQRRCSYMEVVRRITQTMEALFPDEDSEPAARARILRLDCGLLVAKSTAWPKRSIFARGFTGSRDSNKDVCTLGLTGVTEGLERDGFTCTLGFTV